MSSIKDLCQVLNILPPLDQSTCIGYSQRKSTCGCAVALSSRESADRNLRDVSYDILARNGVQNSHLKKIASLLLCKRFHQSQADELVSKWTTALTARSVPRIQGLQATATTKNEPQISVEQYRKLKAELRLVKQEEKDLEACIDKLTNGLMEHGGLEYIITGDLRPTVSPVPLTSSDMWRASDSVLLTELVQRIQNCPMLTTNTIIREIAAAVDESQSRAHTSTTSETLTSSSVSGQVNRVILSPRTRRMQVVTSTQRDPVSRRASPTTGVARPQDTNAFTALTDRATQSISESPIPARHSHVECAACFEPYAAGEQNNYWECRVCQNRTHTDCFSTWVSAAGGRDVRCIYCRAAVRDYPEA